MNNVDLMLIRTIKFFLETMFRITFFFVRLRNPSKIAGEVGSIVNVSQTRLDKTWPFVCGTASYEHFNCVKILTIVLPECKIMSYPMLIISF